MAGHAVEWFTDKSEISFTKDGSWKTVSLSGQVHEDATMVVLQLEVPAASGTDQNIYYRYPGDTNFLGSYVHAEGAVQTVCALNSSQQLQLQAVDSSAKVYLLASFLAPAARAHSGIIDRSSTGAKVGTWDLKYNYLEGSDDASDVECVILVANNITSNQGIWGARCYGSSSSETFSGDVHHRDNWVPVKTYDHGYGPPWGGWYQVYSTGKTTSGLENSYVKFWEVGYILKDYGMKGITTVAAESPSAHGPWGFHNVDALPDQGNEGGFFMMRAGGAPHDHGIKDLTSTDSEIPRWGNAVHDGGCGRARFLTSPGLQDRVTYCLDDDPVDLWLFAYTEKIETLQANSGEIALTASGEVERSLAPGPASLMIEAAGEVERSLAPGAAELVLSAAGQADVNLLPGGADLVLDGAGLVNVNLLPSQAELILEATGEVERSLVPSPAELVLTASGLLQLSFVGVELSPELAELVLTASGQIGLDIPVTLSPSQAELVLEATGRVVMMSPCHWILPAPGLRFRVDAEDQDLVTPAAGGWFDAEGAQEFAQPVAGGWFDAEGAQEFAGPAAGGWFDAEDAQELTSGTDGDWFDAEDEQELTSEADGDWQTRKPCG